MTCGKNADGGNGVTIGRISKVVSEETGCSSVLRSPNDLPISGSKQEFENFLEAADVSIIVALHAFKCGDVLDAACGIDTVKTVLVLGGTDVNVDALSCADNLLTLKRRANAVDAIVAFSDSMVTAAPDGTLASDKVTVIAQGVQLPREQAEQGDDENAAEDEKSESLSNDSRNNSLHCVLGVNKSTPVFLLPAGLRPVKDLLWSLDCVEAAASMLLNHDSRVESITDPSTASTEQGPAFVFAIVGPVLDAAYAETVAERIKGSQTLALLPAVSRFTTLEYVKDSVSVMNTSHSEGQSGALLEAAACGTVIFARDIPGNRALLELLDKAAEGFDVRASEEKSSEKKSSHHPCGFLFDSPETFAETMALLATGDAATVAAAEKAAARAKRGAEGLAKRERDGWREVASSLLK